MFNIGGVTSGYWRWRRRRCCYYCCVMRPLLNMASQVKFSGFWQMW